MSSFARTIRRAKMFRGMNKRQKRLWKSMHKGNKPKRITKQMQKKNTVKE